MPGRRNLARERQRHTQTNATTQLETYHALTRAFPDRALIGHTAILDHFHQLGIRRRNGRPLTRRIVDAWRRAAHCPILRGYRDSHVTASPLSTTHALTAWCLSRFTSHDLFSVVYARPVTPCGSFPASDATRQRSAAA